MSYGNTTSSDIEEKMDFPRNRPSVLVTKLAASKLASEPKWTEKKNNNESDSESVTDNFLTKGAFLLTPSYELSMERAALICEKMSFKGCFSLTKTATGILFKFSHPDDYQAVYKKGFHKVTGARFYRKEQLSKSIPIPCRPRKTFTLCVLDVPDDLPIDDIRHSLFKFDSIVEVVRLHIYNQSSAISAAEKSADGSANVGNKDATEKTERAEYPRVPTSVIRVTLASMDEYNILLQNGLSFYDATFFPTEANVNFKGAKIDYKRRMLDGTIPGRVSELLPVFDAAGFCKFPPPTSKLIKPPRS